MSTEKMAEEAIALRAGEDYIRLSQALKKAALVGSGAEAKMRVRMGEIRVNGEVQTQPGKKLSAGDFFVFDGRTYRIEAQ